MAEKITRFQQLVAWQEAHKLVLEVYRVTEKYPDGEKFGLVSQMRRAAVSTPANIAEGFKRRGQRDKVHFYNIAQASLEELKYYFILSTDLNYLENHQALMAQAESVSRLMYRLMISIEQKQQGR
ncbi:MAG: four helix bundle protein [Chloroflexi bacterium]|nr:MAG: four helix bundle protein [Chloroflexota bacterium]